MLKGDLVAPGSVTFSSGLSITWFWPLVSSHDGASHSLLTENSGAPGCVIWVLGSKGKTGDLKQASGRTSPGRCLHSTICLSSGGESWLGLVNAVGPQVSFCPYRKSKSLLLLRLSISWFQLSLATHTHTYTHRALRIHNTFAHSILSCNCFDRSNRVLYNKGLYNTLTVNIMQLIFCGN